MFLERRAVLGSAGLALAVQLSFACASSPPPVMDLGLPKYENGVRQEPLTVEEVEKAVRGERHRLSACHRSERMNSTTVATLTFRLKVPSDGTKPTVQLVASTIPSQRAMAACVVDVLRRMSFPAHTGKVIELEVPIAP